MVMISTDESKLGKEGFITIKNSHEFSHKLLDNKIFFDMGSICATVKSVHPHSMTIEIQNPGSIYENSQVSFAYTGGDNEPQMSPEDEINKEDVRFCLDNDIDYIILSIYQGKQEILALK